MIDSTWQHLHPANNKPLKSKGMFYRLIKIIGLIVFLGLIIFSITNFPAINKIIRFQIIKILHPEVLKIENQINLTTQTNQNESVRDNSLIIAKINLVTEINWDTPKENFTEELKKGVAHLASSNKPNDLSGNILLAGLSSLPWWKDLGGGVIFTLIGNLESGDRININYLGNYYIYQVRDKKIVGFNEINLNDTSSDTQYLTLLTYTPLGINSQQMLIISELIPTSQKK